MSFVAFGMRSVEKALKNWLLFHDNAPAHRSDLAKYFLADDNATALDHPPYRHALVTADFNIFPRIKSSWEELCFFDVGDVMRNVTEELKSFFT